MGKAGQRIITVGDILCYTGLSAGLRVTRKNEYNITVLTGPSISEVMVSPKPIGHTGIEKPSVIIAIGQEGVDRRANIFDALDHETLIIRDQEVELPQTKAYIRTVDFKSQGIKGPERALASLGILAKFNRAVSMDMLQSALRDRFGEPICASSLALVNRVESSD